MKYLDDYKHSAGIYTSHRFRYKSNFQRVLGDQFVDLLVISIPTLTFLEFKIIGRLFAPEIILICLFPILLFTKHKTLFEPLPKMMLFLLIAWLSGQIITDLIRHVPFEDYSRGWAKIGFTLINFSTIYILIYGKRERILFYAIGIALGGILTFYINPNSYAEDYPWKFGIGESLTWLFIILASSRKISWILLRVGIIVAVSILNLYMGFRSYAGICFLTAVYIYFQWLWRIKCTRETKISANKMLLIALAILTTGFIFIKGYEKAAYKGLLGEKAREILEWQTNGSYGLLLGGRTEILVSYRAILESPIIGHGSWAKDYNLSSLLVYLKRILGYHAGQSNLSELIPTHSHLFGAWVEAGIMGAIFWIWVLSLAIRGMVSLIHTKENLTPLFAFIGFILIWDIFFSPYGADRRFITPYYIIVMMNLLPPRISEKKL